MNAPTESGPPGRTLRLAHLDYAVLQQCMHCGMCLPTCPTYDATKLERNSPRGRIALMRAIADGDLGVTKAFGDEMYFCLGCLACETACPAGVTYARMFEEARADIEDANVLPGTQRKFVRAFALRFVFARPFVLRALGRMLRWYQVSGLEWLVRRLKLTALLPRDLRELEPLTPRVQPQFSDALIGAVESPRNETRHRVGLLTGCVQDLVYPHVNRDTADVLLANGCEVLTPGMQSCCGSLHAHNGELTMAREMARRNIDTMERAAGSLDSLDAIITNAAGCGSHLKHYDELLANDRTYAERARQWSAKLKDIHEWLVEIDWAPPSSPVSPTPVSPAAAPPPFPVSGLRSPVSIRVTYHEACHLCHGQKITRQPREILRRIPGLELVELPESTWCCGSAGIYNITQPEMSRKLLERKMANIESTGVQIVASANPGCAVQLEVGARSSGRKLEIVHPVTLLARSYREEENRE
jgi:glycolate oxidase iron-sulfur subunit